MLCGCLLAATIYAECIGLPITLPERLSLLAHSDLLNGATEPASFYLNKAKAVDPHIASVGWNDVRLLMKW